MPCEHGDHMSHAAPRSSRVAHSSLLGAFVPVFIFVSVAAAGVLVVSCWFLGPAAGANAGLRSWACGDATGAAAGVVVPLTWLLRWMALAGLPGLFFIIMARALVPALRGGRAGVSLPAHLRHKAHEALVGSEAGRRLLHPKRAKEMAERLAESIRIPTVSFDFKPGHPKFEECTAVLHASMKKLHRLLERNYPRVHASLERHVVNDLSLVYIWRGSEDESQLPYCVTAHMDVVPTPNEDKWSVPPFSGDIKDGFVWGRGAMDLKNMVLGWMEAIEDLLTEGFTPRRTLYLTLGHDEEIGGFKGAQEITKWLTRRLGPNPFEFLWDEGLFVIDRVVPGHRGPVAMICTSEKGSLTLELTAQGTPGHSSAPPSETAIGILAAAVSKLERNPMPSYLHGPAHGVFTSLQDGFTLPYKILMTNLWLFGGLLKRILAAKHRTATLVRTTTALTVFHSGDKHNVVPGVAKAIVNHRVHPHDSLEAVRSYDEAVIGDKRVEVKRVNSIPASPVSSASHPAFKTLARTVNAVYPQAGVAPSMFVANSDSRWYWDLAPQIYRFNPISLDVEDTKRFHGIDERIGVTNYAEGVLFMRTFVKATDSRACPRGKAKRA